jgi:hypothetical protein
VVEELHRVGIKAHLAEPADTSTLRGRSNRGRRAAPSETWTRPGATR